MFDEWSLVYFRQIPISGEEINQKRSFLDASQFLFIIVLSSVYDASKNKDFACNLAQSQCTDRKFNVESVQSLDLTRSVNND